MSSFRRWLARAGQVALCASAMAGGAGLAHQVRASGAAPRHEAPVIEGEVLRTPIRSELASLRAMEPAPSPELSRMETREAMDPPRITPMAPFAKPLRDGMIMSGRTPHRMILFTFDDGPDPRYTPRLLDRLDALDVKAVFFLTASRMAGNNPWERRNQALAREIVRRGHIVGNHTLDHAQLPLLDDAGALEQVDAAEGIFERVFGARTWLFRPPGGARSARIDRLLAERGYTQMMWNLGSGDFQVRSADDVVRVWLRVLERREREYGDRGGIVLMHDTHEWSVDAFPRMVNYLREKNCELLERGEELYDIVDDPALFFAPRADADPSEEAPVATPSRTILAERQRALREETARRCNRLALSQ